MSTFYRHRRRVNQSIYGTRAVRFLPQEPLKHIGTTQTDQMTMVKGRGTPSAVVKGGKVVVSSGGAVAGKPGVAQAPSTVQTSAEVIVRPDLKALLNEILASLPKAKRQKDGRAESITVTNTATLLASENESRRRLKIKNESLFYDIRVKIGSQGSNVSSGSGYLIEAGAIEEFSRQGPVVGEEPDDDGFYGAVYAIRTGSNDVAVSIMEW